MCFPPAIKADDFLATFVRYWLPPFVAALERAGAQEPPARIYPCLARLLQVAVDHDLRDYRPAHGKMSTNRCGDAALAGGNPS